MSHLLLFPPSLRRGWVNASQKLAWLIWGNTQGHHPSGIESIPHCHRQFHRFQLLMGEVEPIQPFRASLGSILSPLWSGLREWLGLWFAVPKKKVSHGRKRRRAANKGLKNLRNIVQCQTCSRPKLLHHLCPHCYKRYGNFLKEALLKGQQDFAAFVKDGPGQATSRNNQ